MSKETWHTRLAAALSMRGKTWMDLVHVTKLSKPSVYAWRPTATKRTTMMDGENAAVVCSFLEISPMWLFHNKTDDAISQDNPMPRPMVKRIAEIADGISDVGLQRLMIAAEAEAKLYPLQQPKKKGAKAA